MKRPFLTNGAISLLTVPGKTVDINTIRVFSSTNLSMELITVLTAV